MLKPFLFLLISQALVLEKFFLLEYHIFGYLTMGGYYQDRVHNNIVLFGCNHCYLFLEHGMSYVLIMAIINFMFNGIVDETMVDDGTAFVHFFETSSLILGLFHVPPGWVETPFTTNSFLSLSFLFGFQWQHSLECLLH
jgi:hypothetical protein